MLRFEVNYTGADKLRNALNGLNEAFDETTRKSILQQVGQIYYDETKNRFTKEYDVDRKKWPALRPVTVKLKGHNRIGHKTGALKKSIQMQFTGNSVFIGTDLIYARTFHYFVKKGEFRKSPPVPWGNIPRRSFIGRNARLDSKAITTIKKILIQQMGLDKTFVNENF